MNKGRREGQGERANNNKEFSYVFVWCLFRSLIGPKSGQNPKKKKHPNLQPHKLSHLRKFSFSFFHQKEEGGGKKGREKPFVWVFLLFLVQYVVVPQSFFLPFLPFSFSPLSFFPFLSLPLSFSDYPFLFISPNRHLYDILYLIGERFLWFIFEDSLLLSFSHLFLSFFFLSISLLLSSSLFSSSLFPLSFLSFALLSSLFLRI